MAPLARLASETCGNQQTVGFFCKTVTSRSNSLHDDEPSGTTTPKKTCCSVTQSLAIDHRHSQSAHTPSSFVLLFPLHVVAVAVTRTQFMSASNASWTLLT